MLLQTIALVAAFVAAENVIRIPPDSGDYYDDSYMDYGIPSEFGQEDAPMDPLQILDNAIFEGNEAHYLI